MLIFKIKTFFNQLVCKHEWRCLNEECEFRNAENCGDSGLISGYGWCWNCFFRSVECKKCGKKILQWQPIQHKTKKEI